MLENFHHFVYFLLTIKHHSTWPKEILRNFAALVLRLNPYFVPFGFVSIKPADHLMQRYWQESINTSSLEWHPSKHDGSLFFSFREVYVWISKVLNLSFMAAHPMSYTCGGCTTVFCWRKRHHKIYLAFCYIAIAWHRWTNMRQGLIIYGHTVIAKLKSFVILCVVFIVSPWKCPGVSRYNHSHDYVLHIIRFVIFLNVCVWGIYSCIASIVPTNTVYNLLYTILIKQRSDK